MTKLIQLLAFGAVVLGAVTAVEASSGVVQGLEARGLSDRAFLAAAKQRTSTLNAVVDSSTKISYRKLRLLKTPDGRRVCGELQDDIDQTWTRFYTDLDDRGAELEPYAAQDLSILQPFENQCSAAVRKLAPGARGSQEDIRACAAAGLASQAKLERARFDLLFALSCEEKLWPRILAE